MYHFSTPIYPVSATLQYGEVHLRIYTSIYSYACNTVAYGTGTNMVLYGTTTCTVRTCIIMVTPGTSRSITFSFVDLKRACSTYVYIFARETWRRPPPRPWWWQRPSQCQSAERAGLAARCSCQLSHDRALAVLVVSKLVAWSEAEIGTFGGCFWIGVGLGG